MVESFLCTKVTNGIITLKLSKGVQTVLYYFGLRWSCFSLFCKLQHNSFSLFDSLCVCWIFKNVSCGVFFVTTTRKKVCIWKVLSKREKKCLFIFRENNFPSKRVCKLSHRETTSHSLFRECVKFDARRRCVAFVIPISREKTNKKNRSVIFLTAAIWLDCSALFDLQLN